jgi:hypothetical protein
MRSRGTNASTSTPMKGRKMTSDSQGTVMA